MLLAFVAGFLFSVQPVQAHTLDTAFFDFEQTASGTVLTVAMQPAEAFEVVRRPEDEGWNLDRFRERGDVLAAFVASRVALSRGGRECDWDPAIGPVVSSTLDVLADGITVAGPIVCPIETGTITLETDLFTDRFPGQQNIVRIARDDSFSEVLSLTSSSRFATLDFERLWQGADQTPAKAGARILDVYQKIPFILFLSGLATILAWCFTQRWTK